MAKPDYVVDLTIVDDAEDTTGWDELSGHKSGGADAAEGDYFIQGSGCISQSTGAAIGTTAGLQFDYGSNITLNASDCFFMWHVFLPANAIATWASGGIRIGVGSSAGNMDFWNSGGSDFGRNPYGGWHNVAVDPTYSPDTTDGTPTGTYRFFGSLPNITSAVSKGNPHGVDAIRYGRGEFRIYSGSVATPCTFEGIASVNDNATNRFGLFQAEGTGYLNKGFLSLGYNSTPCYFEDSNVNIVIDDTPRTYKSFNKIEVTNVNSTVLWAGVNITALNASQLSRGSFTVASDAKVTMTNCVFTDIDDFVFDSKCVLNNTTFRRCGAVTQAGADIDDCTFDESIATTAALLADTVDDIDGCTFTGAGNHAIQIRPSGTPIDVSLSNCVFTDYATSDGTTGSEALLINPVTNTATVTVNILGQSTPSVMEHADYTGSFFLVINPITLKVQVQDSDTVGIASAQVAIYKTSDRVQLMNEDTNASGLAEQAYAGEAAAIEIRVRKSSTGATKYIPYSTLGQTGTSDYELLVTLKEDTNA